jgi:hypothetical protein
LTFTYSPESALSASHFQSVDEVKLKMVDLLNRLSADDLQHCFAQWKIHMECCMDGEENTFKGIEIL